MGIDRDNGGLHNRNQTYRSSPWWRVLAIHSTCSPDRRNSRHLDRAFGSAYNNAERSSGSYKAPWPAPLTISAFSLRPVSLGFSGVVRLCFPSRPGWCLGPLTNLDRRLRSSHATPGWMAARIDDLIWRRKVGHERGHSLGYPTSPVEHSVSSFSIKKARRVVRQEPAKPLRVEVSSRNFALCKAFPINDLRD
jgi:hypothetical protein